MDRVTTDSGQCARSATCRKKRFLLTGSLPTDICTNSSELQIHRSVGVGSSEKSVIL